MNKKTSITDLKDFLDEKVAFYLNPAFIESDPVQIPSQFSKKEDIEIIGFITATISWGKRLSIIQNAEKLLQIMDHAPYDFVMNYKKNSAEQKAILSFVHRTFNGNDLDYFIKSLKNIYKNKGGLEQTFLQGETTQHRIENFRSVFLSLSHESRLEKHVSSPMSGSASKRINMYLRWMVRESKTGVDFGLWKGWKSSNLMLPLDVHTGNVSRKLGLLKRKQNDWKAVEEVTEKLREMDPKDPIKYDFALFGLGVFEKF